jgi:DNA-binding transcriptional ArsR family regulator
VKEADALDATISALAEPTRRAVVELLLERPKRPVEMAQSLGISAQALSRHLRVLRSLGAITDDDEPGDARARVYRLCPEAFLPLNDWLTHVESFWQRQLGGFKQHAEARILQEPGPKKQKRR